MRLAVIATHPVQYHSPLFRRLTERGLVDLHVFYGWAGCSANSAFDHGFGQNIRWDIPLLEGYASSFVSNRSADPGTHWFGGLDSPDLVSRVLDWRPDAVLVFGWAHRSHLRALRKLHGRVPVLFRGDSTLIDEARGPRSFLRRMWLRRVYQRIDLALHVGTHNREYFLRSGLAEQQLRWVPHAVDNARFEDPTGDLARAAGAWRRRERILADEVTFLFAGKLEQKKAPDVLLSAFKQLKHRGAHLVFVGSGPLEPELREQAKNDRFVHFTGFQNQSQMPLVYRLGDVFVLPSRGPGETWGLAVNEAMASSRPVIVTSRVGCAPDLVDYGRNGFVVAPNNPVALAGVLSSFIDNPGQAKEMSSASAEIIARWTVEEQAVRLEMALQRAALPSSARDGCAAWSASGSPSPLR